MSEKISKETTEGILKRITSPWFFTFIPWWVVFNYDFLILVFGKVETLNAVRTYYKCVDVDKKLSIFGCIDFYGWGNNQFFWKLLFPILATVVSMVGFAYGIAWVQDKYNSIMEKDYFWRRRTEKIHCQAVKGLVDFYWGENEEVRDKIISYYSCETFFSPTAISDELSKLDREQEYKIRYLILRHLEWHIDRRYYTPKTKFWQKFKNLFTSKKTKPLKDEPSN